MRKFLLVSTLIVAALLVLGAAGGYALAKTSPLMPGSAIFKLQVFAERQFARITSGERRAAYEIDLAEHRAEAALRLIGTGRELAALEALDQALGQVIWSIGQLPEDSARAQAIPPSLLDKLDQIVAAIFQAKTQAPEILLSLKAKAAGLHLLASKEALPEDQQAELARLSGFVAAQLNAPNPGDSTTSKESIDPQAVAFLPGSPGALHDFYPLAGKHAELDCQSCHSTGEYAGTPTDCAACHILITPAAHYAGDCAMCHAPDNWKTVHFNHASTLAKNCATCHDRNKPVNHYGGICSACHTTSAWIPATFSHSAAGATNCQSCHFSDKPTNHFSGQCGACHSTSAWKPANFSHSAAGATNCQSCHAADKPANHFSGQCGACHSTNAWKPANFSHSAAGATNCQSCHGSSAPANHYSGQCGACHSTNAWKPANFSHSVAGATNCQSCHAPPGGHYNGQCSACHSTNAWTPANFSHSAAGATNCQSCHAPPGGHYNGQCSACHSTNAWKPANFSHSAAGATDCQSCHSSPSPHWNGQCSQCHSTNSWQNTHVNGHSFPTDHGHSDGSCSDCHENNKNSVNCYKCHDKAETDKHHEEKNITDIGGRCLECHPNGSKESAGNGSAAGPGGWPGGTRPGSLHPVWYMLFFLPH